MLSADDRMTAEEFTGNFPKEFKFQRMDVILPGAQWRLTTTEKDGKREKVFQAEGIS